MRSKVVSGIILTLLLIGMLTLAFNIQTVKAFEVIYIMADGSIIPSTAPIVSDDNSTYTLTADITSTYIGIEVRRSNIIIDGNRHTIQGPRPLYGSHGIDLGIVNNVTIKNMEIKAFNNGIYVYSSANNSIYANNLLDNAGGISLEGHSLEQQSSMNNIFGNNITDNLTGIGLWYRASDNNIYENNITNNHERGIVDDCGNQSIYRNNIVNNVVGISLAIGCSESKIYENNIAKNSVEGIRLFGSDGNLIYNNNIIENVQQVRILASGYPNFWDDGYPSGGNYWSDYQDRYPNAEEIDDSGIWNTSYVLDENNQDNFPLVEPWSPRPPTPPEALEELIETIDTWDLPNGMENSLTSKLDGALHLLDIGNENGAIHKLMDFINQVEAQSGKKLNDDQADYLIAEAQRIINLIEG